MRITRTDTKIVVRCEGDNFQNELEVIKYLPAGVYSRKDKVWNFPLTSAIDLMNTVPVEMLTDVSTGVLSLFKEEDKKLKILIQYLNKDWTGTHEFLMGHQNMVVHIARLYDRFACLLDTGTGKTITGLQIIQENPDIKWVVIPPKSTIKPAWRQDALEFYPELRLFPLSDNFLKEDYQALLDRWGISYNKRATKSVLFDILAEHAQVFVINTESFKKHIPLLQKHGVKGCIFDESVKIKSVKSQITKDFTEYADRELSKVYLLSGKAAPNGEEDYFPQMRVVDPAIFGTQITKFKEYFFEPNGMFSIRLRRDKKEEFAARLARKSIIVRKQDCLDLPPEVFEKRVLEFDSKTQPIYREMLNEFLITIEGENFKAINAGVLRNKLRQLTSGFAYLSDGAHRIHNTKINMVKELLEELGDEPVIIWVAFQEDVHALVSAMEAMGVPAVTAYSGTKNLDASVEAFMQNKARVIIAHPGSIKYGITFCGRNMVRNCTNAIYYSFTENYDDFYQSKDRIYRKGQTEKVTYFFLMMENSVDTLTYKALMNKGSNASLMEDLVQLAKDVLG